MIPKSATTLRRGEILWWCFHLLLPFSLFGKRRFLPPSSASSSSSSKSPNAMVSSSSSEKVFFAWSPSFAAVNDDANARDEDFLHKLGVKLRKGDGERSQNASRESRFVWRSRNARISDGLERFRGKLEVKKYGPIFKTAFSSNRRSRSGRRSRG